MSFEAEEVLDDIADILDEIDPKHSTESELRTAVRRISQLVADAGDGEEDGDEDDEEDDLVEVEEDDEEEEAGEDEQPLA